MSTTVRKCTCGKSPALIKRLGRHWYCCPACGETSPKVQDAQVAAHEWNKMQPALERKTR